MLEGAEHLRLVLPGGLARVVPRREPDTIGRPLGRAYTALRGIPGTSIQEGDVVLWLQQSEPPRLRGEWFRVPRAEFEALRDAADTLLAHLDNSWVYHTWAQGDMTRKFKSHLRMARKGRAETSKVFVARPNIIPVEASTDHEAVDALLDRVGGL